MAGHSKFKNIMYRKGAQDKKRAKIFSRLGREITVAAKKGGADIETNARLRSAINSAKSLNMPKENIERAINKADGNEQESNYEEIRYEGYGPLGVALVVEALTNNKNRTAAEIRSTFSKYGGNLGENGSVIYNFQHLGLIRVEKKNFKEDEVFNFVAENGSIDMDIDKEEYAIYCKSKDLHDLNSKICNKFGSSISSELIWKSESLMNIEGDNLQNLFKLINTLEENEDVQSVSSNCEFNEKALDNQS